VTLELIPFPHCGDRFRYSGALFLVPTEGEAEGMRTGPRSSLCGDAAAPHAKCRHPRHNFPAARPPEPKSLRRPENREVGLESKALAEITDLMPWLHHDSDIDASSASPSSTATPTQCAPISPGAPADARTIFCPSGEYRTDVGVNDVPA
jgi:hypothetical protein